MQNFFPNKRTETSTDRFSIAESKPDFIALGNQQIFEAHTIQSVLIESLEPERQSTNVETTSITMAPRASRTPLVDAFFPSDQRITNKLSQKPTDALIGIIYQAKAHCERKDHEFKARVEEIGKLHQKQVSKLWLELQNALKENESLGRQIDQGKECQNALANQLETAVAQYEYQQAVIDQVEMLVREGQQSDECLRMELRQTQNELTELQRKLLERENQMLQLQQEHEADMSIQKEVGVRVVVQKAENGGVMRTAQLHNLTSSVLEQIKVVKRKFSKSFPRFKISKIEYIMNDFLFNEFNMAKNALEREGRPVEEQILFHGTSSTSNISKYLRPPKSFSDDSIIMEGFRIGGVNGHTCANGAAYVLSAKSSD